MAYEINFCETKEQLKHLAEVASGKVEGSPSGADIDESTLTYTGQVRRTLPKLIDQFDQQRAILDAESEEAINTYRRVNAGFYNTGPYLDDKFTYTVYLGDRFYPVNPPYQTQPGSIADPNTDPNLAKLELPDEQYVRTVANQTAEQIVAGEIYPNDYDQYLQVGDTLTNVSYVRILDGVTIRLYKVFDGPLNGNVDAVTATTSDSAVVTVSGVDHVVGQYNSIQIVYSFAQFGGKCNGVDSDDDAFDAAVALVPKGCTLTFAGMALAPGEGLVLLTHHVYNRSDITIDFAKIDIYWRAPTGYIPDRTDNLVNNPRSPGIICFRGELTGVQYSELLSSSLDEFSEVFPVPGVSSAFTRGSWWVVTTDVAAGTTVGREIDYLIESQGDFGNADEVRMNYRTGWGLAAGRTLTYKRANPVSNIKLLNMGQFYYEQTITDGTGTGTNWSSQQATSFVSFELATNYEVTGLEAFDPPYTVIWEQWCSNGKVRMCSTNNPTIRRSDQVVGRNSVLYGLVEDCQNKSGSNICDHTGSAYCVVRNSRETGTKNGAFTHHGSYEHDIHYENTTGVLSIANSGADYGESAKRITATNHNGTQLIADKKVSDCTFTDCVFSEFAKLNADNNELINTDVPKSDPSALGGLIFAQSSTRTGKGAVISGGKIELSISSPCIPSSVTQDITFIGSEITDFRARVLDGFGLLTFDNVTADGGTRGANNLGQADTVIKGGKWTAVPFKTTGTKDQVITLDGGYRAEGFGDVTNNRTWDFDKDSGGELEVNIGTASFNDLGSNAYHFRLSAAASSRFKFKSMGATYTGGRLEFQPLGLSDGYIYHKGNVEDGVTRSNVPTEAANVSTLDNMII